MIVILPLSKGNQSVLEDQISVVIIRKEREKNIWILHWKKNNHNNTKAVIDNIWIAPLVFFCCICCAIPTVYDLFLYSLSLFKK